MIALVFIAIFAFGLCVSLSDIQKKVPLLENLSVETKKNETKFERILRNLLVNASDDIKEDAKLDTAGLLTKYGYPVEDHYVKTDDGYILRMFRIPHNKKGVADKGSVFLMHGLFGSSADWLLLGAGKGLAYFLSDLGYDVWLGNARGNRYSKNHTTLNNKDPNFWKFSWHQIGYYDVPAMLDHLLAMTGENKTFHIGHSQGTTSFYVMCSLRPEYNDKIRAHFSLAPIAFMKHMTSPLLHVAAFWKGPIERLLKLLGEDELFPNEGFVSSINSAMCSVNEITKVLCSNCMFAIFGFNSQQLNTTLLPIIFGHDPAGAATKQIVHYAQEIRSGHFRQYDFDFHGNMKIYGRMTPPDYELGKVTAPVYLHSSNNDWLAAQKDVQKLFDRLGNCQGNFIVSDNRFNHVDFIFAMNAPSILYPNISSLMTRH